MSETPRDPDTGQFLPADEAEENTQEVEDEAVEEENEDDVAQHGEAEEEEGA